MDEHTSDNPGPFAPAALAYDNVVLTAGNLRLLTACAVMEDPERLDLNDTLGRALLLLRDRLTHGPAVAASAPVTHRDRQARARLAGK